MDGLILKSWIMVALVNLSKIDIFIQVEHLLTTPLKCAPCLLSVTNCLGLITSLGQNHLCFTWKLEMRRCCGLKHILTWRNGELQNLCSLPTFKNKIIPSCLSVPIKTPLMSSSQRNVPVLFQFESRYLPKCYFVCNTVPSHTPSLTPPPFPITPRKFLPEIPFHINQWRCQNQGTPPQQDLLRARLRLFFSFLSFFPSLFFFAPCGVIVQVSCYSLSLSIIPQ